MREATGRGHAKVILSGEHWVLDGAEALAIGLPQLGAVASLREAESTAVALDSGLTGHAAADAARMVELALQQAGVTGGVAATVRADVPLRRGLGSSAAVAVALVRAAAGLCGAVLTQDELRARARALESLVHGRSSGLDPAAASCDRGGVLFCSGEVLRNVGPVHPALAPACWLLVDLGPGQPTRTAVAHALARREAMTASDRQTWLDQATQASRAAAAALENGDLAGLAVALQQASTVLDPLDVATDAMRACVQALHGAGALAAKQTGAGLGGVVLALCENGVAATRAAEAAGPLALAHWILPLHPTD